MDELWKLLGDKTMKRILKDLHSQRPARLQHSLLQEERYHIDPNDDEAFVEYGFLGRDLTDEECVKIVREMEVHNYSMYDCSGKPCTFHINWHRNPSGLISYQHWKVLDV